MKLFILYAVCALGLQSFCFANQIPIMQDSIENQGKRVDTAIYSIGAAHLIICRIQKLVHDDPNKAADLCLNAIKFLINAEACLCNQNDN